MEGEGGYFLELAIELNNMGTKLKGFKNNTAIQ